MIIIVTIIWGVLASLFAIEESKYFHYRSIANGTDNPHILFTLIRGLILGLVWLITKDLVIIGSLILMFSFIHDGVYYISRNLLDNSYPKGWFSQSTTSTSLLDKLNLTSPIIRTISFIIGLIILIWIMLQ